MTGPTPTAAPTDTTPNDGDPAAANNHENTGTSRPFSVTGQNDGPTPIRIPPLPNSGPPTPPGTPTPTTTTTPNATNPPGTPNAGATTPNGLAPNSTPSPTDPTNAANHHGKPHRGDHNTDTDDTDGDTADTSPATNAAPEALNALAGLGPQLAGPLLSLPGAAIQGAGSLMPALASAVLPQLATLAHQLGIDEPPGSPTSRMNPRSANNLAGPHGSMGFEGPAADQARLRNEALARRVGAMHDVEAKLGDILGLSSANTENDRAKIKGIIDDVETALASAGAQGNTPEAQTAVLTAMRKALDDAGNVVSSAARNKLSDAQFVRNLIQDYLAAADTTQAGVAGSGAGADAARIAHDALGLPYVWGGGGALGPTGGGFDCSGLTQWAIARASGGRVILPRTTYDQIHAGTAVPLGALAPGDLVFSNWSSPGVPEHVAIYIGNGQVIEAPQQGVPVHISGLPNNAQARRVL